MRTKKVSELVDNLPKEQKNAILGIIDLKIESDMKTVLQKLEQIEQNQNLRFNLILGAIGFITILMSIYKFIG